MLHSIWFHLSETSRIGYFIETEIRFVVSRNQEGEEGSDYLWDIFLGDEKILKLDRSKAFKAP